MEGPDYSKWSIKIMIIDRTNNNMYTNLITSDPLSGNIKMMSNKYVTYTLCDVR